MEKNCGLPKVTVMDSHPKNKIKICKICNISKTLQEFYFRKDSQKYRKECKDCFGKDRKVPNIRYKKTNKYKKWKKEYDSRYHKTDKYKKYNSEYNIEYRKIDKNKQQQFANNLRKYWPELSTDEAKLKYEHLLTFQNNKCAICKNSETRKHNGKVRNLSVDHCHKTGTIRGLLCSRCNITIGHFEDNANYLKWAAAYLENFSEDEIK